MSSKFKTFAAQKTLLRGQKDKLQSRRKFLKTTNPRKDQYQEHTKNSQNLTIKKQRIQLELEQRTQ